MKFITEQTDVPEQAFRRLGENDGKQHLSIAMTLFGCGGYMAGGAARRWLRMQKAKQAKTALDEYSARDEWTRFRISLREQGDIDFFFPDEESYFRATMALRHDFAIELVESATGAAMQFTISDVKYQLVKFDFAPIEQMLESFDIVNACVAYTLNTVTYSDKWEILELRKELDVINWTSPHTICRVARYCQKNELTLHRHASAKFAEYAVKHAIELRANPIDGHGEWRRKFSHKTLLTWLSVMLPQMTNSDLVLLSAAYANEKYDWAVRELFDRSPTMARLQELGT